MKLYTHHLSTVRAVIASLRTVPPYLTNLATELAVTTDITAVDVNLIVAALTELDELQERAAKRRHTRIGASLRKASHALHTAALYNPWYQVWDGCRYALNQFSPQRWTIRGGGVSWTFVGETEPGEPYSVYDGGTPLDHGSEESTLAWYLVRQAKADAMAIGD